MSARALQERLLGQLAVEPSCKSLLRFDRAGRALDVSRAEAAATLSALDVLEGRGLVVVDRLTHDNDKRREIIARIRPAGRDHLAKIAARARAVAGRD
jgi:DNA-binding MarR family transcriptional regulator